MHARMYNDMYMSPCDTPSATHHASLSRSLSSVCLEPGNDTSDPSLGGGRTRRTTPCMTALPHRAVHRARYPSALRSAPSSLPLTPLCFTTLWTLGRWWLMPTRRNAVPRPRLVVGTRIRLQSLFRSKNDPIFFDRPLIFERLSSIFQAFFKKLANTILNFPCLRLDPFEYDYIEYECHWEYKYYLSIRMRRLISTRIIVLVLNVIVYPIIP